MLPHDLWEHVLSWGDGCTTSTHVVRALQTLEHARRSAATAAQRGVGALRGVSEWVHWRAELDGVDALGDEDATEGGGAAPVCPVRCVACVMLCKNSSSPSTIEPSSRSAVDHEAGRRASRTAPNTVFIAGPDFFSVAGPI